MISRLPGKPASTWTIVVILVLLVITCAVLAGCSSSGGGTSRGTSTHGGSSLTYDEQYVIHEPDSAYDVVLTCIKGEGVYVTEGDGSVAVVKADPLCPQVP